MLQRFFISLLFVALTVACSGEPDDYEGETGVGDAGIELDTGEASDLDEGLDAGDELDIGAEPDIGVDTDVGEDFPESPDELVRYRVGGEPVNVTPDGPGLMLMGGGLDVDEAFRWWIERLDGGDLVVIRTSGADGYNDYVYDELGGVNSVETLIVDSRALADDPYVVRRLQQAAGIFMTGGDQLTYLQYWAGTGVEEALRTAHSRGAMVGGTSAGLAVMGEFAYTAAEGRVYSDEVLEDPYNRYVTFGAGLLSWPSLESVITDSHFRERDRMGRLMGFLARLATDEGRDDLVGLGIDERTALVIGADGRGQVMGEGDVYLLRNRPGEPTRCEAGQPLETEVNHWALRAGDTVTLPDWEPESAPAIVTASDEEIVPSDPYRN